ncbi:hypothetical protein EVAR_22701_1 [Eumeta japonica]|uniref:Uncharacterized protein n=1 Tax=Eumeta variegata TaxID=151549 RepID=A0A4C1USX5_EUMVA|nr:hypothetical protein EVAR_22701_1 [Eumeta japonica]
MRRSFKPGVLDSTNEDLAWSRLDADDLGTATLSRARARFDLSRDGINRLTKFHCFYTHQAPPVCAPCALFHSLCLFKKTYKYKQIFEQLERRRLSGSEYWLRTERYRNRSWPWAN